MVKLTNVPCVIMTIKSYIGSDSGNEGEEGVTSKIKKLTLKMIRLPRAGLRIL